MLTQFNRELVALNLPRRPGPDVDTSPVRDQDLEQLPHNVQRYLRFMGVVGMPRTWSFRLGFHGRFRRSRNDSWMKCQACQYSTRLGVARIFHIRVAFFGLLPVIARDTYVDGRGRMLIRMLDRITVGDGQGEAYDIGELVTYLNDGLFIAPSMLLVPEVKWADFDARAFDVSLTDHGRTVTARVSLDDRGAPLNFETTDRFYADPKDATKITRCRWTTPLEGWQAVAGRQLPTRGQAVWHPPGGDLPYADFVFDPQTVAWDVAPGE